MTPLSCFSMVFTLEVLRDKVKIAGVEMENTKLSEVEIEITKISQVEVDDLISVVELELECCEDLDIIGLDYLAYDNK